MKAAGQSAAGSGISALSNKNGALGGGQVSFFALLAGQRSFFDGTTGQLPGQGQVQMDKQFSPDELRRISVQLRLGEAAVRRHLAELASGAPRGVGYRDPRSPDWARLDQRCYSFLVQQVGRARRGRGYVDVSGKQPARVELWQFARYELERQSRLLDHFSGPDSGIRDEAADYLGGNIKLLGRFYTHLAGQLEAMLPAEVIEASRAWDEDEVEE